MSYSQENEEALVLAHFGERVGSFLDIGAADGVKFSNTRALAECGWGGLCVEPSPRQFLQLWEVYRDSRKVKLLNAALVVMSGIHEFHYSPDTVVCTLDAATHEEWSRDFKYSSWFINTLSVYDFLYYWKEHGWQFISVDAEGLSWAIALALIHHGVRPEMWCIEHDKGRQETLPGYKRICDNANNTMWVRE